MMDQSIHRKAYPVTVSSISIEPDGSWDNEERNFLITKRTMIEFSQIFVLMSDL